MKAVFCLVAASVACGTAFADTPWLFKAGISQVQPASTNGNLDTPLGQFTAEVSDEVGFTPAIEYTFAPNLSAELLLAIPYEHDVELDGVKMATFKHLPPTVTLKYSGPEMSGFTPYVGAGLNYTFVYDEQIDVSGVQLKGDDSAGFAGLIGVNYKLPDSPLGAALDVRYINIESDLTLNGTAIGKLKVNPWVIGLSLSYDY